MKAGTQKVREATRCDQEGCGVVNEPGALMIYSPPHNKWFGLDCHRKELAPALTPTKGTPFYLGWHGASVLAPVAHGAGANLSTDIYARVPTNLPDGTPNPALPDYVRRQRE